MRTPAAEEWGSGQTEDKKRTDFSPSWFRGGRGGGEGRGEEASAADAIDVIAILVLLRDSASVAVAARHPVAALRRYILLVKSVMAILRTFRTSFKGGEFQCYFNLVK